MFCRRFTRRLEVANREKQWEGRQREPRNDAEAVHESQQAYLMLELPKDAALRSYRGIRACEPLADEVIRQGVRARALRIAGTSRRRTDVRLVEFVAALGERRDKRDAKATAPVCGRNS
jgi:hypothetical protein